MALMIFLGEGVGVGGRESDFSIKNKHYDRQNRTPDQTAPLRAF